MSSRDPIVVKIGGGLINGRSLSTMWASIREFREDGPVVLVHGGGPQATAMARRLGHEPQIVHGRRVTTDLDLSIMKWTVRGDLNLRLVSDAQRHGLNAVGLSAADGQMVQVTRRPPWQIDGTEVDFGWVGDVKSVDTSVLRALCDQEFLPVVAPIAGDTAGGLFNVNADTIAMSIASSLRAHALLLVTETGSLREGPSPDDEVVSLCDRSLFDRGVADGWIQGGMRVKLKVAFDALGRGVQNAWIVAEDDLSGRTNATRVLR